MFTTLCTGNRIFMFTNLFIGNRTLCSHFFVFVTGYHINYKTICAPSKDSYQLSHPRRLISLCCQPEDVLDSKLSIESPVKNQVRLLGYTHGSEFFSWVYMQSCRKSSVLAKYYRANTVINNFSHHFTHLILVVKPGVTLRLSRPSCSKCSCHHDT